MGRFFEKYPPMEVFFKWKQNNNSLHEEKPMKIGKKYFLRFFA